MATFQIRRGGSSAKGTLGYGEPYLNADSQSIVFGASGSEEITLVKLNTGKTSSSKWSGSLANSGSLSITGDLTASNAYFAGNVFVSGNIKIGDQTSDVVNLIATLSGSLTPDQDSIYDVGASNKKWNKLFVNSASIVHIENLGNVTHISSSLASLNGATSSLYSYTASNDATNTTQNNRLNNLETASGSLNSYTSSQNTINSIINTHTQSVNNRLNSIEGVSGSYATTGSNNFIGNQKITGSLSISAGEFNVVTGSGAVTSSLTFDHTQADGVNLELKYDNNSTNDEHSLKVKVWEAGIYTYFKRNGTDYPIFNVENFLNRNLYIYTDTRLYDSTLTIDNNLFVKDNAEITGSLIVLGGVTASIHSTNGVISGSSQIISILDPLNNASQSIHIATASLNSFSASVIATGSIINTFTSSVNSYTSSLKDAIELTGSAVTIKGNLLVKGVTTTVNSTTVDIGDNIISLNGSAASNGGLIIRDASGGSINSGSILWDTANDYWIAGIAGAEERIILETQYNTFSSSINSRGVNLEIQSASFHSYSSSINSYTASNNTTNTTQNSRLDAIETSTGSLNTYTASNDATNTTQNSRLNS